MTAMNLTKIVCLAALAAAAAACRRPTTAEPSPAAQAEAAPETTPDRVHLTPAAISESGIRLWKVQPVDLEHLVVLTGSVSGDENRVLQIAANVRGRVAELPVDLGARVRRGDALVVIESVELARAREDYLHALSELRLSTRAHERAQRLMRAGALSAAELQQREADALAKQAAAQASERALHVYGVADEDIAGLRAAMESQDGSLSGHDTPRLVLRAPFQGRVIERRVTPGALFEALQPLLTLADLTCVWVFLQVYEKDLGLLHEGVPVTIRTEAYPQDTFEGRLDHLGSLVDAATRTARVRAKVTNPAEKLRPGMFVTAQVHVPRSAAEAHAHVAVPRAALQTLEGRPSVFIQSQPGVFLRRFVETGHTFEGFTEILAGVKEGELVVSEGSFVLKSEFAKASLVEEE